MKDTIRTIHLTKPGEIPPGYLVRIPDSAGLGAGKEPWGISIACRKGRFFIRSLPSVIYDQGGAEVTSLDTIPYPELRKSVGSGVKSVISLYTQAGINIYLYFSGGRFQVYWPDEET